MLEQYVQKNGKILRRGYTTGTCAAAAAKAAAAMLFSGRKINEVEVTLPIGEKIVLKIVDARLDKNYAQCCVVKDAGDDPDVTHGAKICARVRKTKCGVVIRGGEGVG
ncbi:MAG: cobalt-precorrin-5B (C(1))-methyltransferase, partial [Methanobacteriota archaeon]